MICWDGHKNVKHVKNNYDGIGQPYVVPTQHFCCCFNSTYENSGNYGPFMCPQIYTQSFCLPFNTSSVGANIHLAMSLFLEEWGSPLRRAPRVGGRAWLGGGVGVEL